MYRSPHLESAKQHWMRHLFPEDTAVDATAGNGHDTLYLAKLPLSSLFALDIQEEAIQSTRILLNRHLPPELLEKITLLHMPHDDLRKVPYKRPPRLIVYNLGYLPGKDKSITTKTESTLSSIRSALSILGEKGAISITCYPGHEEGKKEEEAIFDLARSLSSKEWEVSWNRWINRERSPNLFWISRLSHF